MNTYGISEKSYFLLLNTFSKYPEIEEVILFGSRAKGNYKKGSDIDLAIKGEYCNKQIAMNINGFVNEELSTPYHVDIISYNELDNDNLKEHVNRVGKIFYKKKA